MPEARTLLEWAEELGIASADAADASRSPSRRASQPALPGAPTSTADDCLRALAIKGFAPAEAVADVVAVRRRMTVRPILDQLVADGLAASVAGAYRLTEQARAGRPSVLDRRTARPGAREPAAAALDAFLALDHRVKVIVTAWQLRGDPERAVNDHSDADYDRDVLARLAALHADAMAWLTPPGRRPQPTGRLRRPARPAPSTGGRAATTGTWPHRASTATTASGSSSTRTSSASPAARAKRNSPPAAPERRQCGDRDALARPTCRH